MNGVLSALWKGRRAWNYNSTMKTTGKLVLTLVALVLAHSIPGYCIYPVFDAQNFSQNLTTALKEVQQAATQVQQYQTELLQWKTELLQATGLGPALQVYQQAQATMRQVMGVASIFQNGSGLQNALQSLQDPNYWLQTPVASYTPTTMQNGLDLQYQANTAFFNGINAQSKAIQDDAAQVDRLQQTANGVQGQLQALETANQLAALEQKQLLQIRQLLLQEQQSLAARNATMGNSDAMTQAASEQFISTVAGPESHTGW